MDHMRLDVSGTHLDVLTIGPPPAPAPLPPPADPDETGSDGSEEKPSPGRKGAKAAKPAPKAGGKKAARPFVAPRAAAAPSEARAESSQSQSTPTRQRARESSPGTPESATANMARAAKQ